MLKTLLIFLFTCTGFISQAQVSIITTIAGTGVGGYGGDGGPAISAKLHSPSQSTVDRYGNIYIVDYENNRIRKVDLSSGIITTVAGKGTGGMGSYSGDGGPATNADLWVPQGICTDTSGNVYIADGLNHRIRKITVATGIITTIVGNGIAGSSGDGGPATSAMINGPSGVAIDKFGNIYVCEAHGYKIRKVDAVTHIIRTIAGTGAYGYSGNGGPAISAKLDEPGQPIIDNNGNVIFSDINNNVIRKIDVATGIINTIAGTGTGGYSGDGGLAIHAQLNGPYGICFYGDSCILFSEYWNGVIRKVNLYTNIISTVAGTGSMGYSGDGGPATNAKLIPDAVVVDEYGSMIISDIDNHRIRKVYRNVGVGGVANAATIVVYPNPASNSVTIQHAKGCTVFIINLSGQEVFKAAIDSENSSLNVSKLPGGNYVLKIVDGTGKCTANKLTVIR